MKQLWKRLIAHVKLAAQDFHAKTIGLTALVIVSVHDFLTTTDVNALARWTGRQWAFHVLKVLGAPLLAWLATTRQHQDATAIANKLRAAGYDIDSLPDARTRPQILPVPPAPPAAGFVRLRVLVLLAVAACAGAAALVVLPASASVRPGETIQFLVEGATSSSVTWSITEGATGGTISATGLYTAPCPTAASTFHVTAAAGGVTSSPATVNVASDHVASVVVTPSAPTLQPLTTQQFTATVTTACGVVSTDSVSGAALLRKATK